MPTIARAFLASLLLSFTAVTFANYLELPPGGLHFTPPDPERLPPVEECGCPTPLLVVGYMNLIDPLLVAELEREIGAGRRGDASDVDLALALLERLRTDGVLEPGVYAAMLQSIEECLLPRELIALFLFDVVTGVEFLSDGLVRIGVFGPDERFDIPTALAVIAVLGPRFDAMAADDLQGLRLPPDGLIVICEADVRSAITQTLLDPDVVSSVQDRYAIAISPIADKSLTNPRERR